MFVSEILKWKQKRINENLAETYIPHLDGFINYFEKFFKKNKINEKKPYKGLKDEKAYPVELNTKDVKAIIIKSQTINYLIIYSKTKYKKTIKVCPFVQDSNAHDDLMYSDLKAKPSLKYVMKNLSGGRTCLFEHSLDLANKKVYLDVSFFYGYEDHVRFLSVLEFTCLSISGTHPGYDAKDYFAAFKPVYNEYDAYQKKQDDASPFKGKTKEEIDELYKKAGKKIREHLNIKE